MKENKLVEKNYDYFEKNIEELLTKYKNKYLVIMEEKVIFDSDSFEKVLEFVKGKYEPGQYIIQKCEKPDDSIQVFYSRVN